MTTSNNFVCYEIFAENIREGTLIIKNLEHNNYFIKKAHEILDDKKLLTNFSDKDINFLKKTVATKAL